MSGKVSLDCTKAALPVKSVINFADSGVLHVAVNMPLYDFIIRKFKGGDLGKPTLFQTMVAANISKGRFQF